MSPQLPIQVNHQRLYCGLRGESARAFPGGLDSIQDEAEVGTNRRCSRHMLLLEVYIINSSTLSFSGNVVQEATRVEVLLMFRPRPPTYTFSCLSIPKTSLGCSKEDILYLDGIYTSIHPEDAVYSVSSPSSPSLV